jgi:hypothetical protein
MVPSRQITAGFGGADPHRLAQLWAGVLGRKVVEAVHGLLLPGDDAQLGLRFVHSDAEKTRPNRMHVHLTSTDLDDQRNTVARALGLGASHLDVGQREDEGHIVLADPQANELCIIEPGNSFLAGCGFLGELACDGSRDVGVFWSQALGWPLVWDQDEETAIQSPEGGTKIAWGGPPVAAKGVAERQHFYLATDGDRVAEVARLVGLGATSVGVGKDGAALLADPDGFEFCLLTK